MAAHDSAKTCCKRGHPFSAENTRVYQGRRICKTCVRDKSRVWYLTHPARHRETTRRWRERNRLRWSELNLRNQRQARAKNPEKYRRFTRDNNRKMKREVFAHYGDGQARCVRCGFADLDALCLDHVNNDGAAQRRASTDKVKGGLTLYRRLRQSGYPTGFQTLCGNCNMIKEAERHRAARMVSDG